jgi:3-deoxy-D-manno-octulosonic-acid transferase
MDGQGLEKRKTRSDDGIADRRLALNLYSSTYNFLWRSFGFKVIDLLSRKSQQDSEFKQGRLGFYDGLKISGKPRIWSHAASVGEVTGAIPTLFSLKKSLPHAALFLSTGTPQGLKFARAQLPADVAVFPFPFDFPGCVSKAISTLQPELFVNFETEFWPNFFRELNARGIPALLLNGRVSSSSERFYRIVSPLFRPVFEQFTHMAMHSDEDRERIVRIGAPPSKISVLGSSKYDGLAGKASPEKADFWRGLLDIGNGPVIIGGSLRGSETIELMRIHQQLRGFSAGLLGIFAPRHMNKIPKMIDWLKKNNTPYDLLSQIEEGSRVRTASVVLVDRIGVLFEIYSVGDLIFCGGTFEPVGGHNILEPPAWSRAVFYGPCLKKVLHEHRILRNFGGSFVATGPEDLFLQWKKWLGDLSELQKNGEAANRALNSLRGVVDRQVELILDSLRKAG